MKLIKAIYNAPDRLLWSDDEDTFVQVKFNNKKYLGSAHLHPHDKEYSSEKVGYTIALSRARIKILREEKQKAKNIYFNKINFYKEVMGHGVKDSKTIDPTSSFWNNVSRSLHHYSKLSTALEQEERRLKNYLDGQDRFIKSMKKMRQEDTNN